MKARLAELEMRVRALEEALEGEKVELKDMPVKEAMPLVLEYLKKHPGAHTSDVVFGLKIDNEVVETALDDLEKEGKIEPIQGQTK